MNRLHVSNTGGTAAHGGATASEPRSPGGQRPVRMVVADPNEVYRLGVRSLVTNLDCVEVVGEASEVGELVTLFQTTPVDLVLLDPGIGGSIDDDTTVIERVKEAAPDVDMIIINDRPRAHTRRAIELGVRACLKKTAGGEELGAALRLVADGRHYIQLDLLGPLLSARSNGDPWPGLSTEQVTMLHLLSRGLSNQQISSELGTSMTTLKSHLRLIYSKLDAANRAEAAAAAVRLGIVS